MSIQDAATLKSYFETGDKPTQAQFGDLVDTIVIGPHLDCGTTTGGANTYNLTADADVTSLTAGQTFTAIAHQTNTSTCQSSINGLSPVQITKLGGTAVGAGDIVIGQALTLYYDGNSRLQLINPASVASSGTVTSVGLSMPAEFSVTGSPVNTSGTLTVTKATQTANTVYAGPTTGAAATPAFRALVAADLPAGTIPVLNSQVFTSSGTFTTPLTTLSGTVFKFTVVGAGGGGGGAGTTNAGSGGAGGGTAIYYASGLAANTGYTINIGAAGTAGTANNDGGVGGNSSVVIGATTITANGGGKGQGGTNGASITGGTGGSATNGTINVRGQNGGGSGIATTGFGGPGGNSLMGFGGPIQSVGAGGGTTAQGYGGGGSGTGATANFAGSAGAQGIVVVEWVI